MEEQNQQQPSQQPKKKIYKKKEIKLDDFVDYYCLLGLLREYITILKINNHLISGNKTI